MRYRNEVTGAIIDVPSEVKGGNWEKLDGGKAETLSAVSSSEEIAKPTKTRKTKK